MTDAEQRAAAKATTAIIPVRVAYRRPGHERQASPPLRNPARQPFPQVALWINCPWRRSCKLGHTRHPFDSRCWRACFTVSPVSVRVTGAHRPVPGDESHLGLTTPPPVGKLITLSVSVGLLRLQLVQDKKDQLSKLDMLAKSREPQRA